MTSSVRPGNAPVADRFAAATAAVVRHLPFGLDRVVAPTLVGFAVINATTFGIDLGLLTLARSGLHWPLPAAVSLGYATAFAIGFGLNRLLNFRSHGAVGSQLAVYVAVVAVNYLVLVLGLVDGLARAGVDYRLARLIASACEVVYLYAALRWLVFRDRRRSSGRE